MRAFDAAQTWRNPEHRASVSPKGCCLKTKHTRPPSNQEKNLVEGVLRNVSEGKEAGGALIKLPGQLSVSMLNGLMPTNIMFLP